MLLTLSEHLCLKCLAQVFSFKNLEMPQIDRAVFHDKYLGVRCMKSVTFWLNTSIDMIDPTFAKSVKT